MTMFILAICVGMCQIHIKGAEDEGDEGEIINTQYPMPNAQCWKLD